MAGQVIDINAGNVISGNNSVCGNSTAANGVTGEMSPLTWTNCTLSPDNNTLNINTYVSYGYTAGQVVVGAYSGSGDVENNTVNVNATAYVPMYGGYATGSGNVLNNKVIVHASGSVPTNVYGGAAESGNATGNWLIVESGGRAGTSGSGSNRLIGGHSLNGNATDNHVVIESGANIPLMGGWLAGGHVGATGGDANGNSVTIMGGSFDGGSSIYGGYAENANTNAMNNTITLGGNITLSAPTAKITVRGGRGHGTNPGDVFTGNTLNINNYTGAARNQFAQIHNFQYFNFVLPDGMVGGSTYLTADNLLLGDVSGNKSEVKSVAFLGNGLHVGDKVILIDSAADATFGGVYAGLETTDLTGQVGLRSAQMRASYDSTNHDVVVEILGFLSGAPAGTQSLPQGFISGAAFINQATDFIADRGMLAAVREAERAERNLFAAISGGSLRYNTGSHVDVDGYSLLVGASAAIPSTPLILGAFVEHGEGDYDSYNNLAAGRFRGDGNTRYYGLGMLARLELNKALHLEGSLRGGRVKTDYDSRDFGLPVAYEAKSGYLSAHAGIGYRLALRENSALKLYGQYLYSRQDGDKVTLANGDPVKFAAVDSSRLRLGARWDYALTKSAVAWVGAAWEYEFDGKARARYYDDPIDAPDLKGDTGMLEIGFTLNPAANQPLSLDFGLQGYAGKREGATGSFRMNYAF